MSNPDKYIKSYDFSSYQEANPTLPLPAPQVDNELIEIQLSIGTVVDSIEDVRRSDGALKNLIVTTDSLAADVRSLMLANFNPRGDWATATAYAVKDTVVYEGATYMCALAHTSSSFTTDLANKKWLLVASPFSLSSDIFSQTFSGNGVQTTFTLAQPFTTIAELAVYVQDGSAGYQRLRTTGASPQVILSQPNQITISSAPATGTNNIFVEAINQTAASAAAAAANSATQAATSATSAVNSASQASTSASQASTSASSAATAAASSASSAASAASSAASVEGVEWRDVVFVSANVTVDQTYAGKLIIVTTTGGAVTVTLPLLSATTKPYLVGVKKASSDANTVTIQTSSPDLIEGSATKTLSTQGSGCSLIASNNGASDLWTVTDFGASGGSVTPTFDTAIYYCGNATLASNVYSATNAKITSLVKGLTVSVNLPYSASMFLDFNLNNLGAARIRGINVSSNASGSYFDNSPITLTYDGSNWRIRDITQFGVRPVSYYLSSGSVASNVLNLGSSYVFVDNGGTINTLTVSDNRVGTLVTVQFRAACTLVHDNTKLDLFGSNISAQVGDVATFMMTSANVFKLVSYTSYSGKPLVSDLSTGSISLFNENVTPTGWLWQNGAAISRTTYANLFAVIGTTYGAGDGSTTFNLPDDRYGDVFFDLTTGGTASGSSNAGGSEYIKAFDKNLTTWWLAGGGGTQYVQYDFGRSKLINYVRFYDYPYPSGTVTHTVLGSTDNVTFTTLGSLAITYTSETQTWADLPLTTSGSYRYLRMNVLYSGGTAGITEVQFGLKSKKFIKF